VTYRSPLLDAVSADASALTAAVKATRLPGRHVTALAAEELRLLDRVARDPARYRSLRAFLIRLGR
jgi:hypothetical protein